MNCSNLSDHDLKFQSDKAAAAVDLGNVGAVYTHTHAIAERNLVILKG